MGTLDQVKKPRYRWVILFVSLFAFVAYAFSLQSGPPLIVSVKTEFHVPSDTEAALLMSIVLFPGIFLSLPAGIWIKQHGIKRVGTLSLIGIIAGNSTTAFANSFIILLIGRLILGVGGAFIVTATPAIIAQWFEEEDMGKAMGIFGINMPLATITALPISSALMLAFGWRFPFYICLGVGIVAAATYLALAKDGPFAGHGSQVNVRKAFANMEVWKVGLVWLFFNAAALSFITWAPTLFEQFQQIPIVQASLMASLLMWSTIFLVPLYGYLSDKIRRRRLFVLSGFTLMTLAFVLIAFTSGSSLVASIILLGLAASMIPPIVSVLPAQILGPDMAGVGFGITATCLNVGSALSQPSIGFVYDMTKSYSSCLLAVAAFSAVGMIVACTLKAK